MCMNNRHWTVNYLGKLLFMDHFTEYAVHVGFLTYASRHKHPDAYVPAARLEATTKKQTRINILSNLAKIEFPIALIALLLLDLLGMVQKLP